ncbi:hypothetical protein GCM10009730_58890 [Streptomyces albidochromogenes]|uniref:hypothetical protein n=1 Tax=Streptomyces albidochromogenes TaxID=329524 RepID=UPI00110FE537|nr:hypothetical protein [Streptomyces albidochromogenes]
MADLIAWVRGQAHDTVLRQQQVGRAVALRPTEQLQAAVSEARRAATVLAVRVRVAYRARLWVALEGIARAMPQRGQPAGLVRTQFG